jgi:hypothetical protein
LCARVPFGSFYLLPSSIGSQISSIFKLDRRWRTRWVALTDGFIFYWKDEADFRSGKPHKGAVDLRDCSLATAEQHTNKVVFNAECVPELVSVQRVPVQLDM